MKTLVIYDNDGKIFLTRDGDYLLPNGGVQYLEVEITEGKRVKGVDVSVTPHQAIFEDIPPSEIELLQAKIAQTDEVVLALLESMYLQ